MILALTLIAVAMTESDLERLEQCVGIAIGNISRRAAPVRSSKELKRVLALPRAHIPTQDEMDALRDEVTLPGARMRLTDTQVNALLQARRGPGLVGTLGVGVGKTLISCLLPTALGCRGLVLAPTGLVAQARLMCAEYRHHFRIRGDLEWLAYATLSDARFADRLRELGAELLVCDEAHFLRHKSAARTRRFLRYLKENPSTKVCVVSGTLTSKSVKDFAHLLFHAQKDYLCLPRDYPEMVEWSEALDSDPVRPPGALVQLCAPGETPREGWSRHLRETPGVVASCGALGVDASLVLRRHRSPSPGPKVRAILDRLMERWEMPYGPIDIAAHMASVVRQLRIGGYYEPVWDPSVTPEQILEYTRALSCWNKWLSEKLRYSSTYDSPGQLLAAIPESVPEPQELTRWREVRETTPKPGKRWVCVESIASHVRPLVGSDTLVWVDYSGGGKALASDLELPYHGAGDDPPTSGSAVVSIRAHGTGRNLQHYSHNVVAGGTPNGAMWEQLLGRTHRTGQESDGVVVDLLWPKEAEDAREDAKYIQEITGTPQRLLVADWCDA